jgi:hypothetical protein
MRKRRMNFALATGVAAVLAAGFVISLLNPQQARATVIINAAEVGGDVVFSYSGTIDLTGLGAPTADGTANMNSAINPNFGAVLVGNGQVMDFWQGPYTFIPFGPGGFAAPSSEAGPGFSIYSDGFGIFDGYVSNAFVSGSMSFNGASFASLGMLPGTYEATLPSDNVLLNIGPVVNVPEPGTLALLAFGLLGYALLRRKPHDGPRNT